MASIQTTVYLILHTQWGFWLVFLTPPIPPYYLANLFFETGGTFPKQFAVWQSRVLFKETKSQNLAGHVQALS